MAFIDIYFDEYKLLRKLQNIKSNIEENTEKKLYIIKLIKYYFDYLITNKAEDKEIISWQKEVWLLSLKTGIEKYEKQMNIEILTKETLKKMKFLKD